VQDDRLVVDEVSDRDRVGDVVGERPVAPVGDRPDRAADGGGAVPAAGAELAVGARMQQLEGLARWGSGGSSTNTVPLTVCAVPLWPSNGGAAADGASVVNIWSVPNVVPALFAATRRT
jgi:hypothetical protein